MDEPFAVTRYRLGSQPAGRITLVFQGREPLRPRSRGDRILPRLPAEEVRLNPRHCMYGLTLVRAGSAVAHDHDGRTHQLTPGTLLTWTALTPQQRRIVPGPGFREAALNVDVVTGQHLAALGLWRTDPQAASVGDPEPVAAAMRALARAIEDPSLDDAELLRRTIALIGRCHAAQDAARGSFAARAGDLLAAHPDPTFALADAARELGLGVETFRKRFRAEFGVPPGTWHLRRRMERALELLRQHEVADTARLLGYRDPFQFSRQFRRVVGVPPSHCRGT
jgi:AraC-like DNA-binding protein